VGETGYEEKTLPEKQGEGPEKEKTWTIVSGAIMLKPMVDGSEGGFSSAWGEDKAGKGEKEFPREQGESLCNSRCRGILFLKE